jgi:hypothetical protein
MGSNANWYKVLEDLAVCGCIILKWIAFEDADSSNLAQDRVHWRELLSIEMNIWSLYTSGNFLTS